MLELPQRLSIRSQVLALVLAVVVPTAGLVAWSLANVLAAEKNSATARLQASAAGTAIRLSDVLRERAALMARLAEQPALRTLDAAGCAPAVASIARLHPEFLTLGVRGSDGRLICSDLPNPSSAERMRGLAWFRHGLQADGFTVGNAWNGTTSGRWTAVLTHPLRDAAGQVSGLLILPMDLLRLQPLVMPPAADPALVSVIDADDAVLMRSVDAESWLGKPPPAGMAAQARGLRDGVLVGQDFHGVQRLLAFAGVPGTAWRVVASLPEAEVLAPYHSLLRTSLLVGGLALALLLALAWRLANRIVRPIRALAASSARVAAGDTLARAGTDGPAEIAAVAGQFNQMLDARAGSQQALAASEAQYRFLIDHLFAGVVVHAPDSSVLLCNRRATELLGLSADQMSGKVAIDPAWRFLREDGSAMGVDEFPVTRVIRDLVPLTDFVLAILRAADSALVWVLVNAYPQCDAEGVLQQVVVSFVDISARKQAEQTLAASEDRYRLLFNNSLDGVLLTRPGGAVLAANPAACAIFGMSEAELCARGRAGLVDAHDPRLPALLAQRTQTSQAKGQLTMRRGDGQRFEAEITSLVYPDAAGQALSSLVVRDISRRIADEAERLRLEAQLRESQKMEAVGTLAGGIAHDFNNLLGGLLGNVALAQHELAADHPARASLALINRAGLRARALVQQILAFSRRQPQVLVRQALRPPLEETLALLRTTLPAGVRLEADLAEATLVVACDATQVQQVVMNLCTNAWHALGSHPGRIGVRLDRVDFAPDDPARPPALPAGSFAHLQVNDTGSGIDAATRARIFEPFFTTKSVGQGTGLGLSVAHGIVSTHGGVITLQSAPGAGSCFDVYLPLATAEAGAGTDRHDATAGQAIAGHGRHVLYVDDDEVMVIMVERLLQRAGYRVTCRERVADARATLHHAPDDFDLVVTDFNMPDGSGLDLTRALATLRPQLPVVLTSGYLPEDLRAEALAAGVRALLQKEHTVDDLVGLIGRLLGLKTDATAL
jgi:PAS domain S-box-containing protein